MVASRSVESVRLRMGEVITLGDGRDEGRYLEVSMRVMLKVKDNYDCTCSNARDIGANFFMEQQS